MVSISAPKLVTAESPAGSDLSLHRREMAADNRTLNFFGPESPRCKMQSFGNISIPRKQEIVNVPL